MVKLTSRFTLRYLCPIRPSPCRTVPSGKVEAFQLFKLRSFKSQVSVWLPGHANSPAAIHLMHKYKKLFVQPGNDSRNQFENGLHRQIATVTVTHRPGTLPVACGKPSTFEDRMDLLVIGLFAGIDFYGDAEHRLFPYECVGHLAYRALLRSPMQIGGITTKNRDHRWYLPRGVPFYRISTR